MPTYYPPGKRKGNTTWLVRGYVNGTQREIDTNKSNKRDAERAWEDFAAATRAQERDADRDRDTATFDWACDEYIAARPHLNKQYLTNIRRLRAHFAGWYIRDMTAEDLYMAAHKLRPGLKPQTKNHQVVMPGAAVLHYMASRRLCDYIRIPAMEAVDVQRPITPPQQLEPLIRAATGDLKAILMTIQIHGWRITETCNIREERIDWKRAQIERWVAKSKKWRWCAVDREVMAVWKKLPKRDDGFIFAFRNRVQVYREIDRLIKRLGIKMHYRPHRSRRGFATALRDLGYSIDDIRDAAQWASSQSAAIYVADNPERVRPMFDDLRGILRGKARKA